MTQSMTGFATRRGQHGVHSWVWDLRSVNGKGLDLRLRVPDWIEGLEALIRAQLSKSMARGSVSLTLKVARDGGDNLELRVNMAALRSVLTALADVEAEAMANGVTLGQASQSDVLALRGVLEQGAVEDDTVALRTFLIADLTGLTNDFISMRKAEGMALQAVISEQLDQVASLTAAAQSEAENRRHSAAQTLRDNLARILENTDGVDEGRIAQELAIMAVKSDVMEELDRLRAHIEAARFLLADDAPVGRKFDFLMQEFMREVNTLCSKAQALALTRVGLDLKAVIDQMREQVQNVE